ncbi:MAG: SigE family RNA polymerase sigma factor [Actinomycetales bacterium]|nr:SigE family RNA polymerase sigma factor [Actinomycetales bacterium]
MRQGTEADFRGWVTRRRDALRKTAYLLCGDWYLADDLVQEALSRVYSHWERVTANGDPDSYVRRVLVNLSLDHRRRPSRREEPRAEMPDGASDSAYPSDGDRDRVMAALRAVPPGQRTILVLRYWEDLSTEQTAQAVGTSEGNVKSQASRGLDALRAALEAQDGSPAHMTTKEGT